MAALLANDAWAACPALQRYSRFLSSRSLRQKWWASRSRTSDRALGFGALDVLADAAVQDGPQGERQALVRDLLGHDVLEHPGLISLPVECDEVERAERVEVTHDSGEVSELPVAPGSIGASNTRPTTLATFIVRRGPSASRVDPAQDQAMEAVR